MNWRKIGRQLLIAGTLLGLAFVGASWYVAGALVAPANRTVGPPPNGYRIESITIDSEAGCRLAAWFVPCDNATATVILLHPNRGDRRAMLERAMLLHEVGYATLLIDFQGHGESPGEIVTAGFREQFDVVATVKFAQFKNPKSQNRRGGPFSGWRCLTIGIAAQY